MNLKVPIFFLLISIFAHASDSSATMQNKWHWERIRAFEIKYTPSLEADIDNGGSTAFSLGEFYFQAPIFRGDKNYIGAGVTYCATAPELYGIVADSITFTSRVSHAANILFSYNRTISSQLNFYVEINEGINGIWDDFSISNSHIAFCFLGYKHKRDIYFRGGAGVTHLFGKSQFFPVLGMAIGISDIFGIDILIPQHALFRFRLTPKLQVGTKISYSFSNAGFKTVDSDLMVNYAYSQFSSSLYCDFRVVKMLTLRGEIGGYLLRNIKLIDIENDQNYYDATPSETPYVSISLRWQV